MFLVHSSQIPFSEENWKRKGRAIPKDTPPYKEVKGKKKAKQSEDVPVPPKLLYGQWQTVDWTRPELDEEGNIPKNSYGNIELLHPLHLPLGCVQLRDKEYEGLAKQLKLDYAKAVIEFEHGHGRSFPIYQGIVVKEESVPAIMEAYAEKEKKRKEKERKARQEDVLLRWKKMITGALMKARLESDYL